VSRTTTFSGFLSLFASSSTLLCCALPALLVAIGAGAVLAGIATNFPALVWLSEHKHITFGFSAVMLGISGWLQWRARSEPCPVEPQAAQSCERTRVISGRVFLASLIIFAIGFVFAFVLPLLNE
jgi:hypothetical protein